jgi:hypothetical protein
MRARKSYEQLLLHPEGGFLELSEWESAIILRKSRTSLSGK